MANDDSHHQADHNDIKRKFLQLNLWLEILNIRNVVFYNIHDTK